MRSLLAGHRKLSNHPVEVGQRTEAIVLAELVKRGHKVLIPFGTNHRYDFVLDLRGRFVRVQCKTGRLRGGRIRFNVQSIRSNTRQTLRRSYMGDVDLFLVYCPETERVYALSIDEVTASEGVLRVNPTRNGQRKGIRWAADHELPA
jgi:hypothetical protein